MNNTILLVARILLAVIFLASGSGKFGSIEDTASYIATAGLPVATLLAWATSIFEVAVGIAIIIGFQTRIACYLLAAFCVVSGIIFHYDPADQMQMIHLMKNLAITGGFLALSVAGAGSLSLDAQKS